MPQVVPNNYFHTGVFTAAGAELLAGYTCLGCGVRSKTWVAFRVHRSQCSGRIWATGPEHEATLFHRLSAMLDAETTTASKTPATAMPAAADLAEVPAPVLAALAAVSAVPAPEERDPFLDAPVAALRLLEKWRREQEHKVQLRRQGERVGPIAA